VVQTLGGWRLAGVIYRDSEGKPTRRVGRKNRALAGKKTKLPLRVRVRGREQVRLHVDLAKIGCVLAETRVVPVMA
jgi:hypothetical protein